MSAWIFQGNPDRFDIDSDLQNQSSIYWSVTKYKKGIKQGDPVFIWRAKGQKRGASGIVAKAVVIEEPRPKHQVSHPERLSDSRWIKPESDVSGVKAGLALEEVRLSPSDGMLTYEQLISMPALMRLQILTVRTGTNFKLTDNQYRSINDLWCAALLSDQEVYSPEYSAAEGRILYKVHKVRERNPQLVWEARQHFIRANGQLYCELCGFSFSKAYGEKWNDLIEVHHIKPLHLAETEQRTEVKDLMIVCANCHRAIHFLGDPADNLSLLRKKLKNIH